MAYLDLQKPNYAYIFGFLQADGHLHRGKGRKGLLKVELLAADKPLLETFAGMFPFYSSVRERTRDTNFRQGYVSATWEVAHEIFRNELEALGLPYGRKSTIMAPPGGPFSEADYYRGLVDADGAVGIAGQGLPFLSLTTASAPSPQLIRTTSSA